MASNILFENVERFELKGRLASIFRKPKGIQIGNSWDCRSLLTLHALYGSGQGEIRNKCKEVPAMRG